MLMSETWMVGLDAHTCKSQQLYLFHLLIYTLFTKQESPAYAKVSAWQQYLYEGP